MAERTSVHLEKPHREAINDMDERGIADNPSEAHRILLDAGMREYGYGSGDHSGRSLAWVGRELGKWFAIIGMAFLAFTLFWPVEVRMWAVFFAFASVACYGISGLVDADSVGVGSWWGDKA